jgi:hypothetical protein
MRWPPRGRATPVHPCRLFTKSIEDAALKAELLDE